MINNFLTIDLEDWFHGTLMQDNGIDWNNSELHRVTFNTDTIMELLDRYKVKATFFVLGWIAEHYPEIVRSIADGGHEIASHGYGHQLLYHLTEEQFEADLLLAEKFILKACGVKPIGYRAPSWSVTKDLNWVHQVLGRNGYIYDSSIFPIKTFLYGIPDAPRFPFISNDSNYSITEVPSSTYQVLGKNIPFSGGFYFRALPYWLIKRFYKATNDNGHPVVFYIHPFDFDFEEPRIHGLRKRDQWIQYYGRKHCRMKLTRLLQDFEFTRIDHYISHLWNSGNMNNLPLVTGLFHEKTNKHQNISNI